MSFENRVLATVQTQIETGHTSVDVVKAIPGYLDPPAAGGRLTLIDNINNPSEFEIITYTGRTDNTTYWTLTGVTRALESTTATQFLVGSYMIMALTALEATQMYSITNPPPIGWSNSVISSSTTAVAGDSKVVYSTGADIDITLPGSISIGDTFTYHRAGTFEVNIEPGSHTIFFKDIALEGDGGILLENGNTVTIVAVSSGALEIV